MGGRRVGGGREEGGRVGVVGLGVVEKTVVGLGVVGKTVVGLRVVRGLGLVGKTVVVCTRREVRGNQTDVPL